MPHFVTQELQDRGIEAKHILSWDDYDRLRKVPVDAPASFYDHVGQPLAEIPDPCGGHASWAEHYKQPFREALAAMGVVVTEISQHQRYTSGAYVDQVLSAMRHRRQIDRVLTKFRTKNQDSTDGDADSAPEYFPYRPYCDDCNRDSTTVVEYSDETTELSYVCEFGHRNSYTLKDHFHGKLVWKVDWPMRWAYEQVDFEAGGVDHSSPGSSFTVGKQLAADVFDTTPPTYLGYSFVGTSGTAKMSGSRGGAPTPADALTVLAPSLLRWLFVRRKPAASFSIDFGSEIARIYDEWDALGERARRGNASPLDQQAYQRARRGMTAPLPATERPLPFRTLASVFDVTAGDERQMLRILRDLTAPDSISSLAETRPRLERAATWVLTHVSPDERTVPREAPALERLAQLDVTEREAIALLLDGIGENWSLSGLTGLVYGVPKLQRGLPLDTPPSDELKRAQRSWFAMLYELLIDRDTGPRLPTLLLALGKDRISQLLGPALTPASGTWKP